MTCNKPLFFAAFLLMAVPSVWAQPKTVKGTVRDSGSAPVAGVVVYTGGDSVTTAVYTDLDGRYTIQAGPEDMLTFQMMSYRTVEEKVGDRSVIDVILEDDSEVLEQLVVTGYQVISKERATGSFDILSGEQLSRPAASIANRLLGASAGLASTQDAYGNVSSFKIRGVSSFSASSAPLLVVDGFAVSGGFESINPNDVESVTVLKDAAAASIWGARSANGVIVVTTRNGRNSGTAASVQYSGFVKMMPKTDLDYYLSRASSSDVIDYELYAYEHYSTQAPERSQYAGGTSKVFELLQERDLGYISAEKCASEIESYRAFDNSDQIRKYMLQNPLTTQHNISVNVGTAKVRSTFSGMFMDRKDGLKGNDSKTYMLTSGNRFSPFKWLDLSLNAMFSRRTGVSNGQSFSNLSPYEMLYDSYGDPIWYSGAINLDYIRHNIPSNVFPCSNWGWNPAEEINCNDNRSTSDSYRLQAGALFRIIQGLDAEIKAQFEGTSGSSSLYSSIDSYSVRNLLNTTSSYDAAARTATLNYPEGGTLSNSSSSLRSLNLRAQLNFNRTFGNHAVAFAGGAETTDTVIESSGFPMTYGYDPESLSVGLFPNGIPGPGAGSDEKLKDWRGNDLDSPSYVSAYSYATDRYFSAYANLSYTYSGRYTVSGSIRSDASNLITDDPKYRYSPFWSVGANWKISREAFMKDVAWIDDLTIRATVGDNGNVDKSTSFKPLVYTAPTVDEFTNERYGGMSSYGNPTLRWERTRTLNLGLDYALSDGTVFGKIDYYRKHSFDLIADRQLPYFQGASSIRLNNGEILNRGVELEIGTQRHISPDFSFGARLMLSCNYNRVLALDRQPVLFSSLVRESPWLEGYDMNTLWCYKYGGMKNVGTYSSPIYEPCIEDKNGNLHPVTNSIFGKAADFSYDMGTVVAPVNSSLLLNATWRNFDISAIVTGKFGNVFRRESFNYPQAFFSSRAIPNVKYAEVANCDPDKMIPLPMNTDEKNLFAWGAYYPYVSYLVENASVIRLQELNLTYRIPEKLSGLLSLADASVFVVCNNPFNVFFNRYAEDPEFPRGGFRLQPSLTLGAKLQF